MRRPVVELIGKIRLHRTRSRQGRETPAATAGSGQDVGAQRIEIFSEDSKLLRNVLIGLALLSFVYWFQANERIRAVDTLSDAAGAIALEAALSTKLNASVTLLAQANETASDKLELWPAGKGRAELVVDAAAQAMLELERSGRYGQQLMIHLYSPFLNKKVEALLILNKKVEALLSRVDRPTELEADLARDNDALLGSMDRPRPIVPRTRMVQHMALVEQRCPSKWLDAEVRYRLFAGSSPVGEEKLTEGSARLSMGSGTWMLSRFRTISERGHRTPLVDDIAEPYDLRLYFFRAAEPSFLDFEIDCNDFALRWGYEYVGSAPPTLIVRVEDEGHLTTEYREAFDEARRRLTRLSVRLTEGVEAGILGVFLLVPLGMFVLSVWLSIVLRRLAADTDGRIQQLLLADASNDTRRRTILDGPHLRFLERAVRTLCIGYPIIALPLVVLTVPLVFTYPTVHTALAMLLGHDDKLQAVIRKTASEAALRTPLLYVAVVLLVQSVHQLLLIFRGSRARQE